MTEKPSDQEPSIEEILASIRQIISDDDDDENEGAEEETPLESPVRDSTDDVLELTEDDLAEQDAAREAEVIEEQEPDAFIEPDEEIEIDMRDMVEDEPEPFVEPEAKPEPEPEPIKEAPVVQDVFEEQPRPVPSDILSSGAQAAALGSLGKLTSRMPIERSRSYDGVTLEDIVRETLHPMLREWMDDHLPSMVERIVQKEIEKLTRRAMDD